MGKKVYQNEREGQIDFFDNYGIPYDNDQSILVDNTDGVYNGNILEFKLNISNLPKVLFQAIKYLSRMRVKGESVPATILLIDLNDTKVYEYKTADYKAEIHTIYTGAASQNNGGFTAKAPIHIYDYSNQTDSSAVKKILKGKKTDTEKYFPIDIDENCIVGWGERYYRELPKASKGDFLGDETGVKFHVTGEIRDPRHFKGLINPYAGKSNEKFKYLMDCLNDRLSKKDLGAFYTPMPYARKAVELVEMAVQRALDAGKTDYIILDRCAGTGNLESALIGITDVNGDDLIEHCIVSTYEYYEYKVLNERIGDKVREIIPPTEADVVYANGKVSNADAMSEDFVNHPLIKKYLDDENCAIILFENPPYSETFGEITSDNLRDVKKSSFLSKKFKSEFKSDIKGQIPSKEIANIFIWSAFNVYMRQVSDSYILFSPIKYWKSNHLVDKEFVRGFAFNRKYFHASDSVITCALWGNKDVLNLNTLDFEIYDIKDEQTVFIRNLEIQKVFKQFNLYLFDKRIFDGDLENGIYCSSNGEEGSKLKSTSTDKIYNDNIIAYLHIIGFTFGAQTLCMTRTTLNVRKNGFYVRSDNYISKLPLFAAKSFAPEFWYEKDVYNTTADGGDAYTHDKVFLKSCMIYSCLSNQNKCLTFDGSDGRHYQNELCFDKGTLASRDLATLKLDAEEQELVDLWQQILDEARTTGKCNASWTYGVYQIDKEINTFKKVGTGTKQQIVYDFPQLNGDLETLRIKLKQYYKTHITEKMFKYELLK